MLKMPRKVEAETNVGADFKIASSLVEQLEKENNFSLPPKLRLFLIFLAQVNRQKFLECYELATLLFSLTAQLGAVPPYETEPGGKSA